MLIIEVIVLVVLATLLVVPVYAKRHFPPVKEDQVGACLSIVGWLVGTAIATVLVAAVKGGNVWVIAAAVNLVGVGGLSFWAGDEMSTMLFTENGPYAAPKTALFLGWPWATTLLVGLAFALSPIG